ncbi:MAG TPA: ABC transporter permease [Acidobacteriaceae bacterium]|jgi:predicted permease|nr:ABC transporter permease [Acidobacteriaceae bacterium]
MSALRRISNLFTRSKLQREIDRELASHIDLRIEDNIAAGMSRKQARRDALLRFGNPVVMHERTTEADSALYLESLFSDLRYALRQLRRDPAFALTSILILSLGIGACTAIFSAIKPILLDPLPYPHASRLAMLWERSADGSPAHVSFGTFHGLAERSRTFHFIAVMKPWQPAIVATTAADRPERLEGQRVSANFFRTLGIDPKIGRDFQPSDDALRGPAVVILGDRLWHRRFAADPSILGKQVRLDDNLFTVIGIMPPVFEDVLLPTAELWAPLQYDPSLPADGREWGHHLRMIGRLRPGITADQASSEADGILRIHAQLYAKGYASSGGPPNGLIIKGLQHDLTSGVQPALLAVLGAVLLVLSIACVNVTNLVLARAAQRRAEFAMRAALGAAPGRLIRQLLTESLLLALLGGALGMAVAAAGVRALIALSPPDLPRLNAIAVNGSMFLFAFAITALTGMLVGLAPALEAARVDPARGMQQSSRRTAGGRHLPRRVLVVAEVSLAVVLLVGAGLLLRSMAHLFAIDPGFDAPQLLTMQVQESGHQYDNPAARLRFFEQSLERVRQVPGVLSAGFTSQLPLSGDVDGYGVQFEHGPQAAAAFRYAVTPGYLETMHIPLRRGRALNERDITGAPVTVLLNEAFAKRIFPNQNPLGQRVRLGPDMGQADRPWATIVGIVGNVKQESLGDSNEDAFYITTSQWRWVDDAQSLVVRTQGPPAALASLIRDAIWSVDRNQPIVRIATMDNLLAASESERHFVLMLFEAFALVGLILAATGTYGVLSGSVTERTREIGVRAALGASRGSILTLVLRQGMALAALGVFIGLIIAMAASRALAALLFDVSRLDPLTYIGVAALLLAVSCVACFVPGRRAASINPVDALRAE